MVICLRKHVVIVSEESVFAGRYKCGIGEVVDTLAEALREYYDVTVLTMGFIRGGKVGGTVCLGEKDFYMKVAQMVNTWQPDLVHNFARADLIELLNVDCPMIYTFDQWEQDVMLQESSISKYTHVTTMSDAYAQEMWVLHPEAAKWHLKGIINGISAGYYDPGLFFARDKASARKTLFAHLGREDNGDILLVYTGRLSPEKGIDDIIRAARTIRDAGGVLVVYGQGLEQYEEALQELHGLDVLIFIRRLCNYVEQVTVLRAADYYLAPSVSEVCGLQAMKAARLGAVPITTGVGGLGENFNSMNAIMTNGDFPSACIRAINLSAAEYGGLQTACLAGEWTWETRVLPWVELYGLPTAPRSESTMPSKTGKQASPFRRKESAV